eukprot:6407196-Ditylum_brightwellii.AAC.1
MDSNITVSQNSCYYQALAQCTQTRTPVNIHQQMNLHMPSCLHNTKSGMILPPTYCWCDKM